MTREQPPEKGHVQATAEAMQMIALRVPHADYIRWRRAAHALDMSFSAWARAVMDEAADEDA